MKKKKVVALLLAFTMCVSMLAACGNKETTNGTSQSTEQQETSKEVGTVENESSESGDNETELSGKIVIATNRTDLVDTVFADVAQEFMDMHPGTEVEFEAIKDYEQVVATRIAGGEAPDLYQILPSMSADTYADYLLPIDDMNITAEDVYFYDNTRGTDGNLYGLSAYVEYTGVAYNKTAFAKAGIDKVPTTMDEFYEACAKLKDAGIVAVGTAFKDVWPMFPWTDFGMVQIAANGDANGKNSYVNKDEIFDETIVNSMNVARKLYQEGYFEDDIMSANWDQFKIDISQGKTAMHYTASWFPPQMVEQGANAEDVGMFPYPGSKGIYCAPGKVWGISKDTEAPELAKAFLEFMIRDGKEALLTGNAPSWKAAEVTTPFLAELLSYNVPVVEIAPTDPVVVEIYNAAEINEQAFLQAYCLEKDDAKAQAMIDEVNARWAAARAEIVK